MEQRLKDRYRPSYASILRSDDPLKKDAWFTNDFQKRTLKTRQKPEIIKFFLASIAFIFVALFGSRMLLSCAMFRTNRLVETEKLIDLMKDLPSTESIHSFFLHYASQSHLAGSPEDHQLAQWTQKQFIHFGIKDSSIQTYYPYLNYPTNRKLAIISGPPELLYEATLKEAKDETIPAFHVAMSLDPSSL
ncbi:hypothetical protein G6F36_014337 [Rhizopus arrhizus]|nr:hypothetical protein G6F36_014337 [Rhizopus arrhizus]